MMRVEVVRSGSEDAYVIKNMYPLYLHDLAEFSGQLPNAHGVLEADDTASLAEQVGVQDIWWQKRQSLTPFLIRADDRPAGFAFVAARPYAPRRADYLLQEFFVLRPYRRRGVATAAAAAVFKSMPGRWELFVLPGNRPALSFWRKRLQGGVEAERVEEFVGDGGLRGVPELSFCHCVCEVSVRGTSVVRIQAHKNVACAADTQEVRSNCSEDQAVW